MNRKQIYFLFFLVACLSLLIGNASYAVIGRDGEYVLNASGTMKAVTYGEPYTPPEERTDQKVGEIEDAVATISTTLSTVSSNLLTVSGTTSIIGSDMAAMKGTLANVASGVENVGSISAAINTNINRTNDLLSYLCYKPDLIKRYGFIIDQNNSDPDTCVTYLYDAVGKTPAGLDSENVFQYGDWQDFIYDACKPVMVATDGTVLYDLDRNDQTKRVDGEDSDYNDYEQSGNMMVQFKRKYISVTTPETDKIQVVFCDLPLDETYNAYAFMDQYGNVKSVAYYSMFEGTSHNGSIRSLASTTNAINNISGETMRSRCKANGDGWDFPSFSLKYYINYLHVLVSKSLDSQSKFGQGNTDGGQNNPNLPGALISSGGFAGNLSNTTSPVKTFWIENLWGNYWKWHNGVLAKDSSLYIKNTPPYINNSLKGYVYATNSTATDDYIRKMKLINGILLPSSNTGGSSSTYWCDKSWWYNTSTVRSALAGGSRSSGNVCGLWALILLISFLPLTVTIPLVCRFFKHC